jgi:hypothetical protein
MLGFASASAITAHFGGELAAAPSESAPLIHKNLKLSGKRGISPGAPRRRSPDQTGLLPDKLQIRFHLAVEGGAAGRLPVP